MWDNLKRLTGAFTSAVLNARDAGGYPASVRTAFVLDDATQTVRVEVPASVELEPGVASLLFHSHDDQLWNQQIVPVRGALERTPDGWLFRPITLMPIGSLGGLALLRFMLDARKTTAAYLRKRGLERPQIPWARLRELKGKA